MIVVDTGALITLIDRDDSNHEKLRAAFQRNPEDWVLPWAILPEADHLVTTHLGNDAAQALRSDLAQGLFTVDWDGAADLERARELNQIHADLALGLVDAIVMATAERLGARAIATLG